MNFKKVISLVAVLFLVLPTMAQSNQAPKNAFDLSFGTRWLSESTENRALGKEIRLGYHRNIYEDQILFSSSVSYIIDDIDSYNNNPESEYQEVMLRTGIELDMISLGAFSLLFSGGGMFNWSKYRDRNLYSSSRIPINEGPDYFSYAYAGFYGYVGVKFSPSLNLFPNLLMPIILNYGYIGTKEYTTQVGVQLKF